MKITPSVPEERDAAAIPGLDDVLAALGRFCVNFASLVEKADVDINQSHHNHLLEGAFDPRAKDARHERIKKLLQAISDSQVTFEHGTQDNCEGSYYITHTLTGLVLRFRSNGAAILGVPALEVYLGDSTNGKRIRNDNSILSLKMPRESFDPSDLRFVRTLYGWDVASIDASGAIIQNIDPDKYEQQVSIVRQQNALRAERDRIDLPVLRSLYGRRIKELDTKIAELDSHSAFKRGGAVDREKLYAQRAISAREVKAALNAMNMVLSEATEAMQRGKDGNQKRLTVESV